MKRPLLETEKNFIKCAVMMLLIGIGFFALGKNTFGIGTLLLGVVFGICALVSVVKNKEVNKEDDK